MENQLLVIAIRTNTETAPALEVAKRTLQVTPWCDSFFGLRSRVVFGVGVRSSCCQGHGLGRLQPAATDKFEFTRPLRDTLLS